MFVQFYLELYNRPIVPTDLGSKKREKGKGGFQYE